MDNSEQRTCENCSHYRKWHNEMRCNYPMSMIQSCLNSEDRHYYEKDVTKSILPTNTK